MEIKEGLNCLDYTRIKHIYIYKNWGNLRILLDISIRNDNVYLIYEVVVSEYRVI